MVKLLRRLFHLYPGEECQSLALALQGIIWAFGTAAADTLSDALILSHLGAEKLPQIFIATSLMMLTVAVIVLCALNRFKLNLIYQAILATGVVFYAAAYASMFIVSTGAWFWIALKIFTYPFFIILVTCYWSFIDQYYSLQAAKRLFCLFSSSIFLGVAVAGQIINLDLLTPQQIFLLTAFCLSMCIVCIKMTTAKLKAYHDTSDHEHSSQGISLKKLLVTVLTSRFTILLFGACMLSQLLEIVTEYQYMSAFENHFLELCSAESYEATLTRFFGAMRGWVSLGDILFTVFIYGRAVKAFGVNNSTFIIPVLFFFLFTSWLMGNHIWMPILGFAIVEGLLYTIDDNNISLLLNGVPVNLKDKVRVICESFVQPIGMLISATLLLFFQHQAKILGFILAAIALFFAYLLRRNYFQAIWSNLYQHAIRFERTISDWLQLLDNQELKDTKHNLLLKLHQSTNQEDKLLILEVLFNSQDRGLLPYLIAEVNKLSPPEQITALTVLSRSTVSTDSLVVKFIKELLYKNNYQPLERKLLLYLAEHELLTFEEFTLRYPYYSNNFSEMLESEDPADLRLALIIIGFTKDVKYLEIILPLLRHPSQQIASTAARIIYLLVKEYNTSCCNTIIETLTLSSDTTIRKFCLKALGKIGDPSTCTDIIKGSIFFRPAERRLTEEVLTNICRNNLDDLYDILANQSFHPRSRILAGKVLGCLDLPFLRRNLYNLLAAEIDQAYFYYYWVHSLPSSYPDYDLSMLSDTLLSQYYSIVDFIIQLLGVAGSVEDSEYLSHSWHSKNPKVRGIVMETLEKTCEAKLFRLLKPLLCDEIPHQEKMNIYLSKKQSSSSLSQLLDQFGHAPEQITKVLSKTAQEHPNLLSL
ncbi:MAG: hypothetical protein ACQEP8_04805 [Chlamydiota bacterium]